REAFTLISFSFIRSPLFCVSASLRLLGKFPLQVLEIVEGGTSLPRVPISKKLPPCERGGAPPLRGFALNSGIRDGVCGSVYRPHVRATVPGLTPAGPTLQCHPQCPGSRPNP